MRQERQHALKLRIQGYSYTEISKELGIPKSTLSNWFSRLPLPKNARTRIQVRVHESILKSLIKRNKEQTILAQKRAWQIQKFSKEEIRSLSPRDLLLVGVALYWAEGYKKLVVRNGKERTHHVIRLTNSDPHLIQMFLRFLREIMKIHNDRMRIEMRLYKHINENKAFKYWSSVVRLPRKNFQKTTYLVSRSSLGKRPYNRLPFGTIAITVGDTQKFHKIIGWIGGMRVRSQGNM